MSTSGNENETPNVVHDNSAMADTETFSELVDVYGVTNDDYVSQMEIGVRAPDHRAEQIETLIEEKNALLDRVAELESMLEDCRAN